jgi:superfamily II DNA or RNA helicase
MDDLPDFGKIHFSGTLRPAQVAASSVIIPQLESGKKRLHIVAPPGSGKYIPLTIAIFILNHFIESFFSRLFNFYFFMKAIIFIVK